MRLIDADALLRHLEKDPLFPLVEMQYNVSAVIESAPTVDVLEVHHGKWVVQKSPDRYHAGLMKCSVCGYDDVVETDEYNYCPHCGADMRGDVDD